MSEIDEQGWGIIRRTFGVDNQPDNLLAMREVLAQRLGQLAAEDPEQLLRLLYRIDLNERASDHARICRASTACPTPIWLNNVRDHALGWSRVSCASVSEVAVLGRTRTHSYCAILTAFAA